jgi:hypothetical protein
MLPNIAGEESFTSALCAFTAAGFGIRLLDFAWFGENFICVLSGGLFRPPGLEELDIHVGTTRDPRVSDGIVYVEGEVGKIGVEYEELKVLELPQAMEISPSVSVGRGAVRFLTVGSAWLVNFLASWKRGEQVVIVTPRISFDSNSFSELSCGRMVIVSESVRIPRPDFCWKDLTELSINARNVSLQNWSMWGCSRLRKMSLAGSRIAVGSWTISGCAALVEVSINGIDVVLDENALAGCSALMEVSIKGGRVDLRAIVFYDSGLTRLSILGGNVFLNQRSLLGCPALASLSIDGHDISLDFWSFHMCESLASVSVKGCKVSLRSNAFDICQCLTNVSIKGCDVWLDSEAFSRCGPLTSVNIEGSRVMLDEYAFHACQCERLVIRGGEVSLQKGSFAMSSLSCVDFSDVLLPVKGNPFVRCGGTRVTLPNGVQVEEDYFN